MKNLQAPTFLLFLCGVLFFVLFYSCVKPDAIVKDPIGSAVKCNPGEIRNIDGNNYVCTRVTITDGQCRANYGCTEWKQKSVRGESYDECQDYAWDCDCSYTLQCQPENEKCEHSTIFSEELPTCSCVNYLKTVGFTKEGEKIYNDGICSVEKKSFYSLIRQ